MWYASKNIERHLVYQFERDVVLLTYTVFDLDRRKKNECFHKSNLTKLTKRLNFRLLSLT